MSRKQHRGYIPGKGPGNGPRFGNAPPDDQRGWVWFTRDMMESPAWRAMTPPARKVLDRILIEQMAHAGAENGNLIVTYDDFADYGVRRQSIHEAIEVVQALGWIAVTRKGGRSVGGVKRPSTYALTFLPRFDGSAKTNNWQRVTDDLMARRLVGAVRCEQPARRAIPSQDIDRRCRNAPREEPRLSVINGGVPSVGNAPENLTKMHPEPGAKMHPGKIQ